MINLIESEKASVNNIVHINVLTLINTKICPSFNINYVHTNILNTRSAGYLVRSYNTRKNLAHYDYTFTVFSLYALVTVSVIC